MKYKFLFILLLIATTSCLNEYYIPENIKDALPTDFYDANNSFQIGYELNHLAIDTITFIVENNEVETYFNHDYVFGTQHEFEYYSFEAISPDEKQTIHLYYDSFENRFNGIVKLDTISFTFETIEKKIDLKTINNTVYKDIFLLRSDYHSNTYAYISNTYGIIEIVADSITLTSIK